MLHGPIPQNANAPQPLPLVVRCCEASHVDVTSHPTRGPGLWVWDTQTGLKKGKSGYGKSGGYRCEFLLQGYQLWNNDLLWFVDAPQGLLGFFRGSPMWCFSCPAQWFDFLNLLRYAIMVESGMIRMVKWMVHGGIMRVSRKRQSTPYNFTMMVCLLQHSWCRQKRYHDHDIVKVPFQPRVLILSFMFSKCFHEMFWPERNYRTDFPQVNNDPKFIKIVMKLSNIFQLCCPDRF